MLVCSTNVYDGGDLSKQRYVFLNGHTSYYSADSLARLAEGNGFHVDFRVRLVATVYGGKRKRYVLFTASAAVMESTARYFGAHEYAPSESPTANRELADAKRRQALERQASERLAGSGEAAEQLVLE